MIPGQRSAQDILDGKILVVDDEFTNAKLLEQLLMQNGFRSVRFTTDPRKAVNLYQEFKPDLVLLDLNMPYLDGVQVMQQIQEVEKETYPSIVVITADNNDEARIRSLVSGALDFLGKPFNVVEVVARIKNTLNVRLLHNQINSQNKELDQKVRERTRELADTRLEVVQRLGRAAEYRDNETGMHVIRMSRYSSLLGEAVGLPADKCELLLHASPMHDIGKIGIPDSILLKPGKLDESEWQTMKTHSSIGGDILSGSTSSLMQMAETIARTHHEKWDGSGYPNGLEGEDIPLEGRIVAVCDVFDALTSERPYKKEWRIDRAVKELKKQSGRQFDPDLVERFVKILPEIIKIKELYNDNGTQKPAKPEREGAKT
ncbi:MAG: response regulator [candidate division Zixibacteria bacterium]|nr:response regulator [candidate division KSB1 bacterium]NIS47444.1 response regulator [candidate division Zixibacteria bacterium]NIV07666.1 response regulator [candidate division Zixibacteria bacterium]NIW70173.1 response regulator [candidate division KSB1 bacterium]